MLIGRLEYSHIKVKQGRKRLKSRALRGQALFYVRKYQPDISVLSETVFKAVQGCFTL